MAFSLKVQNDTLVAAATISIGAIVILAVLRKYFSGAVL